MQVEGRATRINVGQLPQHFEGILRQLRDLRCLRNSGSYLRNPWTLGSLNGLRCYEAQGAKHQSCRLEAFERNSALLGRRNVYLLSRCVLCPASWDSSVPTSPRRWTFFDRAPGRGERFGRWRWADVEGHGCSYAAFGGGIRGPTNCVSPIGGPSWSGGEYRPAQSTQLSGPHRPSLGPWPMLRNRWCMGRGAASGGHRTRVSLGPPCGAEVAGAGGMQ